MSWGDGVPTYADELAQRLVEQSSKHFEQLARVCAAWRVIRERLDLEDKFVKELDWALELRP